MIGNPRYSPNPLQNNEDYYINDTLTKAPRGNNEFSEGDIEDVSQNEPISVLARDDTVSYTHLLAGRRRF